MEWGPADRLAPPKRCLSFIFQQGRPDGRPFVRRQVSMVIVWVQAGVPQRRATRWPGAIGRQTVR
jgi:hypothetical protein